mmetsp:Transcript_45360/g.145497  ORF Transcript_45360/g.145497 Transcript_45360/m.145497 type:complete len:244 (-) Transcript_45360:48-779(-)
MPGVPGKGGHLLEEQEALLSLEALRITPQCVGGRRPRRLLLPVDRHPGARRTLSGAAAASAEEAREEGDVSVGQAEHLLLKCMSHLVSDRCGMLLSARAQTAAELRQRPHVTEAMGSLLRIGATHASHDKSAAIEAQGGRRRKQCLVAQRALQSSGQAVRCGLARRGEAGGHVQRGPHRCASLLEPRRGSRVQQRQRPPGLELADGAPLHRRGQKGSVRRATHRVPRRSAESRGGGWGLKRLG